jgi:DNA-binding XRE family transcriptional regulator
MSDRQSQARDGKEVLGTDLESLTSHKCHEVREAANKFTDKLAETVKRRRQKLGITQEELASLLQECGIRISQGYISLLEAGQRKQPSLQLVVALSVVLDISLDQVIDSLCDANGNIKEKETEQK